MRLSIGEKAKVHMGRKDITLKMLAGLIGLSRQSLAAKFSRNDFSESEAAKMGAALECDLMVDITDLTIGEKIRVLLFRKDWTTGQLAEASGQKLANLTNKLGRDDFTESEARRLAEAMGYKFEGVFTDTESGEKY